MFLSVEIESSEFLSFVLSMYDFEQSEVNYWISVNGTLSKSSVVGAGIRIKLNQWSRVVFPLPYLESPIHCKSFFLLIYNILKIANHPWFYKYL